jgi:hypothetical protein
VTRDHVRAPWEAIAGRLGDRSALAVHRVQILISSEQEMALMRAVRTSHVRIPAGLAMLAERLA